MKYLKRLWFSVALIGAALYLYGALLIDVWAGESDEEEWLLGFWEK